MDGMDAPRHPASEPAGPWGPRTGRVAAPAADSPFPAGTQARDSMLSRRLWPIADLILIGLILAGFALQWFGPDWIGAYALFPAQVARGHLEGLVTHMFLHGGIMHILFNLSAFVSLAAPVHAMLGDLRRDNARATGVFLLFFLLSGVAGGLLYVALHLGSPVPAVGASGAICGLWGAASRVASPNGELLPVMHPHVGKNLRNFILMNLVLVALVFGLNLLARQGGGGMGGIAWEAHAGGYLLGLFGAPLVQRLARGRTLRAF